MDFDRFDADLQQRGDLLVAVPHGYQAQHLGFPFADRAARLEGDVGVSCQQSIGNPRGHRGVDVHASGRDGAYRSHEFERGTLLQHISGRTGTQQLFKYHHYMRYRVDLTEINFEVNDYQYQVFYDYNDEELADLGKKIEAIAAKSVHVVLNNNYEDQGQRNARTLMGLLERCVVVCEQDAERHGHLRES